MSEIRMGGVRFGARHAYWLLLAAGYGLVLYWNLPGHLSVDSVLALHEGRFRVRETWNPAIFGWLLGRADSVVPGTALAVAVSAALLFGGLAALACLRPRTTWLAPLLALGAIALPQVLIYPGIVWKDVWFAEAAIAAFVALAFGLRSERPAARWAWLLVSALLLAVAGLLRQNGLILAVPAALAIAAAGWPRGAGRSLAGGALWLVLVAAISFALSIYAQPQGGGARPDDAGAKGLRILQTYDLAGAATLAPMSFARLERVDPQLDDELRAAAARTYSPVRVDFLNGDAALSVPLNKTPSATLRAEWLDLILHKPALYLQVRTEVFRWVLTTPDIDRCLPIHLGAGGPAKAMADLGMADRFDRRDGQLYNYVTWFLDTPAYSHVAFGLVALAVGVLLLFRRDPADLAMAALMWGALGFAASFFVISLACDYRYLYLLDMAGVTGLLYLALDPRLRRG